MANYRIVSICLIMKCCGKKSGEKRVDQDQIVDRKLRSRHPHNATVKSHENHIRGRWEPDDEQTVEIVW